MSPLRSITNNKLNDRLISSMRESLTEGENLVNTLMDILLIGKESAYRRLRGEVPFTFEEIAKISSKLGFSVDNILGINDTERGVFDFNVLNPKDMIDDYCEKLEKNIRLYRKMRKATTSKARFALNTLPYSFYMPHENLAKFKLFRWLYQINPNPAYTSYDDMHIPPKVLELQKMATTESRFVKSAFFILDRNVFTSLKYDIEYFYKLNLLSKENIDILKKELFELLSDLETMTITGKYKTGTEVQLYLSNVDLEASYSHYEFGESQYSHLRIFSINGLDSLNPKICDKQKEWIESLRRYSTLITQSGEVQRFAYFKKQREDITNIQI